MRIVFARHGERVASVALPGILRGPDGAAFAPRDLGEAEALVATLDAYGTRVADARTLPARGPIGTTTSGATR